VEPYRAGFAHEFVELSALTATGWNPDSIDMAAGQETWFADRSANKFRLDTVYGNWR
jgi:hypothetical protein